MALFNRTQLRNIFTGVGPQVGDDVADVLEEGVRDLVPKSDLEVLREDIRRLFAEHAAHVDAKFYRAILVLALFFTAVYGGTVGILIAVLG